MDVTGLTHCMGPQPLRFVITIRKQLITPSIKTFYTSGKIEKGQEGTPGGSEVVLLCIHEGIVGLVQQILWEKLLQCNFLFLAPSFPPCP